MFTERAEGLPGGGVLPATVGHAEDEGRGVQTDLAHLPLLRAGHAQASRPHAIAVRQGE